MITGNKAHQGEILEYLVKRSPLKKGEISKMLKIHPSHLARVMASDTVSPKIRHEAAKLFGVDVSIFEKGLGYEIVSSNDVVEEPDEEFLALEAEVARLEEENRQLAEELLKEKAISDELRKLLLKMVKR